MKFFIHFLEQVHVGIKNLKGEISRIRIIVFYKKMINSNYQYIFWIFLTIGSDLVWFFTWNPYFEYFFWAPNVGTYVQKKSKKSKIFKKLKWGNTLTSVFCYILGRPFSLRNVPPVKTLKIFWIINNEILTKFFCIFTAILLPSNCI